MTELSYYPGCTARSTAWEYYDSTVAVAEALDITLHEIPDWNCCGGASAHSLDRFLALGLSARNLLIAQQGGLDLLVSCAGCYSNTKKAAAALDQQGEQAKRLEETLGFAWGGDFAVLSWLDLLERPALVEALRVGVKRPLYGLRVVAYYGCQLVRPPGVTARPSWENPAVLEAACEAVGAQALDWSYKVDCCGADLAITHRERAVELCSRLVAEAREAGAEAMVVACGLCHANLEMRQTGEGMPILYITELLGEALQVRGREKWWKKHLIDPSRLFEGRACESAS